MVIGELKSDRKLSTEVVFRFYMVLSAQNQSFEVGLSLGIANLKITYFYLLQSVCDTWREPY